MLRRPARHDVLAVHDEARRFVRGLLGARRMESDALTSGCVSRGENGPPNVVSMTYRRNGGHSHPVCGLRIPQRMDFVVGAESGCPYSPVVWRLVRNGRKMTCEFVESVSGEGVLRLRYDGMRFLDIDGIRSHDALARGLDAVRTLHQHGWRLEDDPE